MLIKGHLILVVDILKVILTEPIRESRLTDKPQGQVYYNNAGTMMDRNLGATSATPGDVGALGLLYQWGRKDPFLGGGSISSNTVAKSTGTWPSAVSSDSNTGTIAYATSNPTTFIMRNSNNYDW